MGTASQVVKRLFGRSGTGEAAPSPRRRRGTARRRLFVESLEHRRVLAAVLQADPLLWEVIGLDSNNPTTAGPDQFLVGARITNTGDAAISGVTASIDLRDTVELDASDQWVVLGTDYILAVGPTTTTSSYSLNPGESVDVFFGVQISRTADAFDTARRYDITATNGTISDSFDGTHQLYVERLVSQNRNSTISVTVTNGGTPVTSALRGDVLTIVHSSSSAPGGYEQIVNELLLPSSVFEIVSTPVTLPAVFPTGPSAVTPSTSTTFSTDLSDRVGSASTRFYLDASGWNADPGVVNLDPTYRTTTDTQKAGGTSMITTYQVRIRDDAPFGTYGLTGIIYDFSGSSYHYNSDYGQEGATLSFTILDPTAASADLQVVKTDSETTVTAGDGLTHTYTITVTNLGPDSAESVSVTDTWPAEFTQGTFGTPSQGTVTPGVNGAFTWDVGTLAAAGVATLTVTYTVAVDVIPGSYDNIAAVTSTTQDPDPTNNTSTDSTTVVAPAEADLQISKDDSETTVVAGDGLTHTYTITVTNLGPDSAGDVSVTDTWPVEFTQGTIGTPSQGTVTPGVDGAFIWDVGTLAAAGVATLTVTYTVAVDVTPGSYDNTAVVTSSTNDPDPTNNTSTDTTTVVAPVADLSIEKDDGETTVYAGSGAEYTYTITVTNLGPDSAEDVSVADTWPVEFTQGTIGTPSQGTVTPGVDGGFTWDIGTLAAAGVVTLTVTYTVGAGVTPGSYDNTAAVTSSTTDPDPTNNSSTDSTTVVGNMDFGDAPSPYPTLLGDDGARHVRLLDGAGDPSFCLGSVQDVEADGQPNATATGDDDVGVPNDEDGVVFDALTPFVPGLDVNVDVTLTNTAGLAAAYLDAWFDWNADGDWDDADEHVFVAESLDTAGGTTTLVVSVPVTATVTAAGTQSFARFRLTSTGEDAAGDPLGVGGLAADGEVEDHAFTIYPYWTSKSAVLSQIEQNTRPAGNVQDSGNCFAVPDVLVDVVNGPLVFDTASVGTLAPATRSIQEALDYVAANGDVNGDGFLIVAVTASQTLKTFTVTCGGDTHTVVGRALGGQGTENFVVNNLRTERLNLFGNSVTMTAADSTKPVATIQGSVGKVTYLDVHATGSTVAGVLVGGATAPERNADLVVVKNTSATGNTNPGKTGVGIWVQDDVVQVTGSQHLFGNNIGIRVDGSNNVLRTNNEIMSNSEYGILVTGNGNVLNGQDVGKSGRANGAGVKITGNTNTVQDSAITFNAGIGVWISGLNNVVNQNKLLSNALDAVFLELGSNGNQITGNDIFSNGGSGVFAKGGANVIRKNAIGDKGKGNAGYGIYVEGAGNTVQQNSVFANLWDGIAIVGDANTISANVSGDKSKGGNGQGNVAAKRDGIRVVGQNNTLLGNTANANKGYGIYIAGATSTGNKLKDNKCNTDRAGGGNANVVAEYRFDAVIINQGGNKKSTANFTATAVGTYR